MDIKNRWSKQNLEQLVNECSTLTEVLNKMNVSKSSFKKLKIKLNEHEIDYSKFYISKTKYEKNNLIVVIKTSYSLREVLYKLKVKQVGGNYKTLKKYIELYNINISHFTGQGYNVGDKFKQFSSNKIDLNDILINNSTYTNTTRLKKRLIKKELLKNKCYECGIDPKWNNKILVLQLDHINGINNDNRLKNLRILCPNCHSQTKTFCGSNNKK